MIDLSTNKIRQPADHLSDLESVDDNFDINNEENH